MLVSPLRDAARIRAYLRRDVGLHLYELGDLDPFFWPSTEWFAPGPDPGGDTVPTALCLVYRHPAMATLVALADARDEPRLAALSALIAAVAAAMPDTFYAHTSPPLTDAIRTHRRAARGRHLKMVLAEPTRVAAIDTRGVDPLGPEHLDETTVFFREAYPDSWFDGRMLETHRYVGIRERGRLVCVAGVHVHSPRERVAAIGNVATSREHRGRGLATRATAAVCQRLRDEVDVIGLNVAADHATAIHCYQRLGFRTVAEYDESLFTPFGR